MKALHGERCLAQYVKVQNYVLFRLLDVETLTPDQFEYESLIAGHGTTEQLNYPAEVDNPKSVVFRVVDSEEDDVDFVVNGGVYGSLGLVYDAEVDATYREVVDQSGLP